LASRPPFPAAASLTCVLCILLSGGASLAASDSEKSGDAYARISGDIVAEALFAKEAPTLQSPPWLGPLRLALKGESGVYAHASWVLLSDELGAGDRFAGTGSGMEVRFDLRRSSGWGASFAFSRVDRGVYSAVDDRGVSVKRYLLGASRVPAGGGRWGLSPGAGLAWNVFDIQSDDPLLDIEGAGGYVELRAVGRLGRRGRLEAGGRAIYWRGEDGLGGSGDELSLAFDLGLGLRF